MKKTMIAMTIAAAVAAPMSANAAATAYARLQAEVASIDTGAASGAVVGLVDKSQSFLGLKGSEDLGNGLTMIGKMEFLVSTEDANIKPASRQAYVGMKAGFGTVMMGRLPSPYKYAGGVKYDQLVATTLEARGVTMTGKPGAANETRMGHNSFQEDTIGAVLMDGKLSVNYGIDDVTNAGDITIAYKHAMGKNEIHVAHVATGDLGDYTATKIAGKFGDIKAQYETTDLAGVAGSNLFVAYSMKVADGEVVIQGGQADGDNHIDPVVDVTAAYIKKFTKTARYFVGVRSTSGSIAATDDAENTTITYGMRFDY